MSTPASTFVRRTVPMCSMTWSRMFREYESNVEGRTVVLDGDEPVGEEVAEGLVRGLDVLAAVELREQVDAGAFGVSLVLVAGVPLLSAPPGCRIDVELNLHVPAVALLHHGAAHVSPPRRAGGRSRRPLRHACGPSPAGSRWARAG